MDKKNTVTSKSQLIKWFEDGNKKKEDWRVGTEHEKFAYNNIKEKNFFMPVEYSSTNGIEKFLLEISKHGWEKVYEERQIIALKKNKNFCFLIGPEGGFSEEEVKLINNYKQVVSVKLFDRILRAETAAIMALSIYNSSFENN